MKQTNANVHKSWSRREFMQVGGITVGIALLSGCAMPAAVSSGETGGDAASAEGPSITWWNQFSSATTQEIVPEIVQQFTEKEGVAVEFELSGGPPGGGDYIEVLLARIAAGNPPDTITLWSPPSEFGARGSLEKIDDFMASASLATPDAFFGGPLRSCQWQGETYGLPASAGAGSIFINKAKFEEKGVSSAREDFPQTWDGLAELSATFTEWDGDELMQAGIVPWANSWLKPVWSQLNGGMLFNPETLSYAIDSAENEEWLSYWVQVLEDEYRGDIENLNLFGAWESVYPESAFALGTSAMAIAGSWACTDAEIPFEWEIAQFPTGPSGSNSVTGFWPNWWAMPKGTSNPEAGFRFCEYFCTEGWITWYRAIMDTPAWKGFPADVQTQALIDNLGAEKAQELHHFYADYLENAADMWNSPVENFASDTLDAAIDEVLHKTKAPAEALAEAQTVIQSKLEETITS